MVFVLDKDRCKWGSAASPSPGPLQVVSAELPGQAATELASTYPLASQSSPNKVTRARPGTAGAISERLRPGSPFNTPLKKGQRPSTAVKKPLGAVPNPQPNLNDTVEPILSRSVSHVAPLVRATPPGKVIRPRTAGVVRATSDKGKKRQTSGQGSRVSTGGGPVVMGAGTGSAIGGTGHGIGVIDVHAQRRGKVELEADGRSRVPGSEWLNHAPPSAGVTRTKPVDQGLSKTIVRPASSPSTFEHSPKVKKKKKHGSPMHTGGTPAEPLMANLSVTSIYASKVSMAIPQVEREGFGSEGAKNALPKRGIVPASRDGTETEAIASPTSRPRRSSVLSDSTRRSRINATMQHHHTEGTLRVYDLLGKASEPTKYRSVHRQWWNERKMMTRASHLKELFEQESTPEDSYARRTIRPDHSLYDIVCSPHAMNYGRMTNAADFSIDSVRRTKAPIEKGLRMHTRVLRWYRHANGMVLPFPPFNIAEFDSASSEEDEQEMMLHDDEDFLFLDGSSTHVSMQSIGTSETSTAPIETSLAEEAIPSYETSAKRPQSASMKSKVTFDLNRTDSVRHEPSRPRTAALKRTVPTVPSPGFPRPVDMSTLQLDLSGVIKKDKKHKRKHQKGDDVENVPTDRTNVTDSSWVPYVRNHFDKRPDPPAEPKTKDTEGIAVIPQPQPEREATRGNGECDSDDSEWFEYLSDDDSDGNKKDDVGGDEDDDNVDDGTSTVDTVRKDEIVNDHIAKIEEISKRLENSTVVGIASPSDGGQEADKSSRSSSSSDTDMTSDDAAAGRGPRAGPPEDHIVNRLRKEDEERREREREEREREEAEKGNLLMKKFSQTSLVKSEGSASVTGSALKTETTTESTSVVDDDDDDESFGNVRKFFSVQGPSGNSGNGGNDYDYDDDDDDGDDDETTIYTNASSSRSSRPTSASTVQSSRRDGGLKAPSKSIQESQASVTSEWSGGLGVARKASKFSGGGSGKPPLPSRGPVLSNKSSNGNPPTSGDTPADSFGGHAVAPEVSETPSSGGASLFGGGIGSYAAMNGGGGSGRAAAEAMRGFSDTIKDAAPPGSSEPLDDDDEDYDDYWQEYEYAKQNKHQGFGEIYDIDRAVRPSVRSPLLSTSDDRQTTILNEFNVAQKIVRSPGPAKYDVERGDKYLKPRVGGGKFVKVVVEGADHLDLVKAREKPDTRTPGQVAADREAQRRMLVEAEARRRTRIFRENFRIIAEMKAQLARKNGPPLPKFKRWHDKRSSAETGVASPYDDFYQSEVRLVSPRHMPKHLFLSPLTILPPKTRAKITAYTKRKARTRRRWLRRHGMFRRAEEKPINTFDDLINLTSAVKEHHSNKMAQSFYTPLPPATHVSTSTARVLRSELKQLKKEEIDMMENAEKFNSLKYSTARKAFRKDKPHIYKLASVYLGTPLEERGRTLDNSVADDALRLVRTMKREAPIMSVRSLINSASREAATVAGDGGLMSGEATPGVEVVADSGAVHGGISPRASVISVGSHRTESKGAKEDDSIGDFPEEKKKVSFSGETDDLDLSQWPTEEAKSEQRPASSQRPRTEESKVAARLRDHLRAGDKPGITQLNSKMEKIERGIHIPLHGGGYNEDYISQSVRKVHDSHFYRNQLRIMELSAHRAAAGPLDSGDHIDLAYPKKAAIRKKRREKRLRDIRAMTEILEDIARHIVEHKGKDQDASEVTRGIIGEFDGAEATKSKETASSREVVIRHVPSLRALVPQDIKTMRKQRGREASIDYSTAQRSQEGADLSLTRTFSLNGQARNLAYGTDRMGCGAGQIVTDVIQASTRGSMWDVNFDPVSRRPVPFVMRRTNFRDKINKLKPVFGMINALAPEPPKAVPPPPEKKIILKKRHYRNILANRRIHPKFLADALEAFDEEQRLKEKRREEARARAEKERQKREEMEQVTSQVRMQWPYGASEVDAGVVASRRVTTNASDCSGEQRQLSDEVERELRESLSVLDEKKPDYV